jgi:cytochrome c peroxidase
MKPEKSAALPAVGAVITATLLTLSFPASANARTPQALSSLVYNPYPPGILPRNLNSEIGRVRREVRGIFAEAIGAWHSLPPATVAGNPPTLQGSRYHAVEILGKLMNFDENISPFRDEACAFCHMPYAGFSGPIPSVNLTMISYPGTFHYRAGKRTAQRYTYSPDFPVLEYDDSLGAFFGGNFWDAHAAGYKLQSADAEQAHPPVDSTEMGFPDTVCVALRLSQAEYRPLFEEVGATHSISSGRKILKVSVQLPGARLSLGEASYQLG